MTKNQNNCILTDFYANPNLKVLLAQLTMLLTYAKAKQIKLVKKQSFINFYKNVMEAL